jgi:hypothetical protein
LVNVLNVHDIDDDFDYHPTVAVDFDGRIAELEKNFDLNKTKPRPGAAAALGAMRRAGIKVIIWTSRRDWQQLPQWLDKYNIPYDELNENPWHPTDSDKISTDLYLDDRGEGDPNASWSELLKLVYKRLGLKKPAKPQQPTSSKRHLFELATGAQKELKTTLSQLGIPLFCMKDLPVGGVEVVLSEPGDKIILAPIKSESRSVEKVNREYHGDWRQLLDLVRASVACDNMDDLRGRINQINLQPLRVKDRFAEPLNSGYRDILMNYEMSNGLIVEVQFHLKPILIAREKQHMAYAVVRTIKLAMDKEGRKKMTEAEKAAVRKVKQEGKELMDQAWEECRQTDPTLNFDINQPRDEKGQFTDEGASKSHFLGSFEVMENPTGQEIRNWFRNSGDEGWLRGMVADGKMFLWNGNEREHDEVARELHAGGLLHGYGVSYNDVPWGNRFSIDKRAGEEPVVGFYDPDQADPKIKRFADKAGFTVNVFCPTGKGGRVDPSCKKEGGTAEEEPLKAETPRPEMPRAPEVRPPAPPKAEVPKAAPPRPGAIAREPVEASKPTEPSPHEEKPDAPKKEEEISESRKTPGPEERSFEDTVNSKEFKGWFGDWGDKAARKAGLVSRVIHSITGRPLPTLETQPSKVVNEKGAPLLVHHGTQAEFSSFDPQHANPNALLGRGFYFTEDKGTAEEWSHGNVMGGEREKGKSHVITAFLNIRRPFDADHHAKNLLTNPGMAKFSYDFISSALGGNDKATAELQRLGYDGITSMGKDKDGKPARVWIAFHPTQVKALSNKGKFDSKDTNIYNVENYNPNEPRDVAGKWTTGGAATIVGQPIHEQPPESTKTEYSEIEDKSHDIYFASPRADMQALMGYASEEGVYSKLNQEMRACPEDYKCLSPDSKETLRGMETLLAKSPNFEPIAIYRGVFSAPKVISGLMDRARQMQKAGVDWTMPSISSYSASPSAARTFMFTAGDNGVMFVVLAHHGLSPHSAEPQPLQGEMEIIQSPKTHYKVVGVRTDVPMETKDYGKEKLNVIYLEEK